MESDLHSLSNVRRRVLVYFRGLRGCFLSGRKWKSRNCCRFVPLHNLNNGFPNPLLTDVGAGISTSAANSTSGRDAASGRESISGFRRNVGFAVRMTQGPRRVHFSDRTCHYGRRRDITGRRDENRLANAFAATCVTLWDFLHIYFRSVNEDGDVNRILIGK